MSELPGGAKYVGTISGMARLISGAAMAIAPTVSTMIYQSNVQLSYLPPLIMSVSIFILAVRNLMFPYNAGK